MRVHLKASFSLMLLSLSLHVLAFLVLMLLPIRFFTLCFGLLLVLASLFGSLYYAARQNKNALIELGKENGLWWAITKNGKLHRLNVLPDSVVTSHLICFHAKNEQNKLFKTLIVSWEMDPSSFRKLCVALRIH